MQSDYQPTSRVMRFAFAACSLMITGALGAFIDMLADDRFTHAVLTGSIAVIN